MACGQRGFLGLIGIFFPFTMDAVCPTELTNVTWKKPSLLKKQQKIVTRALKVHLNLPTNVTARKKLQLNLR